MLDIILKCAINMYDILTHAHTVSQLSCVYVFAFNLGMGDSAVHILKALFFICSQANMLKGYRDILAIDLAKRFSYEVSMCQHN